MPQESTPRETFKAGTPAQAEQLALWGQAIPFGTRQPLWGWGTPAQLSLPIHQITLAPGSLLPNNNFTLTGLIQKPRVTLRRNQSSSTKSFTTQTLSHPEGQTPVLHVRRRTPCCSHLPQGAGKSSSNSGKSSRKPGAHSTAKDGAGRGSSSFGGPTAGLRCRGERFSLRESSHNLLQAQEPQNKNRPPTPGAGALEHPHPHSQL